MSNLVGPNRFLKALRSGRMLLMDGAMGTELLRAGFRADQGLEILNLSQPEAVASIHRAYVGAGAAVLVANTFQANRPCLAKFGCGHPPREIVDAAIQLARTACPPDGFVLTCVGPVRPDTALQDIPALDPGTSIDGLLLETWSDPHAAAKVVQDSMAISADRPCLVSFAFRRGAGGPLETYLGFTPRQCAEVAQQKGWTALGANCGTNIRLPELLDIFSQYRAATNAPLFVRPNAGTPIEINGRLSYPESPRSIAAWLPALFEAGVVMVGGCCGTTPEHIGAFREVVASRHA